MLMITWGFLVKKTTTLDLNLPFERGNIKKSIMIDLNSKFIVYMMTRLGLVQSSGL